MEGQPSDNRFPGRGIPVGGEPAPSLKPYTAGADDILMKFFKTSSLPSAAPVYSPLPSIIQPPQRSPIQNNNNYPPAVQPMPPSQVRNIGLEPFRPSVAVQSSSLQPPVPYNVTNVTMGAPLPSRPSPSVSQPSTRAPDPESYTSDSSLTEVNGMRAMLNMIPGMSTFAQDVDLSGLSPAQKKAIEAVFQGKNILLTGPAGTGKSHTIKRIKDIYEKKKLIIGTTSTTGASAILIEGKTIHSWAGIGICGSKETALKRVMTYAKPQERIRTTSLLIIDEVSMLSSNMLEILDYVFRSVRGSDRAFGGIQVILCGDFFQLKPVKANDLAFESAGWNTLINEVHELTFIFRQDNAAFCKALNEIRIGEVSQETVKLIEQCIGREFEGDIKPTELYPINADVYSINESELWKLATETNPVREIEALDEIIEKPRPKREYTAKFLTECKERMNKDCMAPAVLQMAIGAQVMLIKNLNVDAGLANGSRGVITGFGQKGEPIVKFRNGHEMQMQVNIWFMRVNETTKIKRTQFPIVLAFAVSIHKSQGCTLDLMKVDLGANIFTDGQFYTAISRIRDVSGLSIITLDWNKVLVDKRVKEFYAKNRSKI